MNYYDKYFESVFNEADKTESIKAILKREENKRGRKSNAYNTIKLLKDNQKNEIAIYIGIALANKKTKPRWEPEEILNILNQKSFINKELMPLLANDYLKDKNLSDIELKQESMKILDNIVKNETETITNIRNMVKIGKKRNNTIFIHELTPQQISNIRKSILLAFKILKESTDDFNIKDYLTYKSNDEVETTYAFMNKLMGNNFTASTRNLDSEITVVLQSMEDIVNKGDVTKNNKKKINSWIRDLKRIKELFNKLEKYTIIWPEADKDIKTVKQFNSYFNQLKIGREQAKKVISNYKKRSKIKTDIPSGDKDQDLKNAATNWDETKIQKLIKRVAKKLASKKEYVGKDLNELIRETDDVAQTLLNKFPELDEYFAQDGHPDAIGELSSRLSARIQSGKTTLGRPKQEEDNNEFI